MLVGRDVERSRIGGLLERGRQSRSGVLVVRGDAGVGKSALLEDARARASGMRVLSAAGIESEAALPFAGLHQLVRPVLGCLSRIPGPQAAALRAALGLEAGGGEDRFLVSLAVLSLLAEAAEARPVLCLIDDAHWLDDASADALVFVARRLQAEGIVMLFAAREGERRGFNAPGLPALCLAGLDRNAARELLDRQATLTAEARDRLIDGTSGNPLGLLELAATLTEEQLAGSEALLEPLPVTDRIEQAFLARAQLLSPATQTLLLVAATDDTSQPGNVLHAARRLGASTEALDTAEQAGLLLVRDDQIRFRHPLVRSAVYHAAPLSRRRAAHEALAAVLDADEDADRRAWHRAAASIDPDPLVVEELERAARRARRRSGFAAASLAFERAATLTREDADQARRLTAAAENAWFAGQPERSLMLLERARRLSTNTIQQAEIDGWRGLIEMNGGAPDEASQLLLRAATDLAPFDATRALYLLNMASVAAGYAGDSAAAASIGRLAAEFDVRAPFARILRETLLGLAAHGAGDFADAAGRFGEALRLGEDLDDDAVVEEPAALLVGGRAALFLADERRVYSLHRRAAVGARASGALTILSQALPRLAHAELWLGRWASAEANLQEGVEFARAMGQDDLVAHMLAVLALHAALRGDELTCRSLAAEGRDLASERGVAFSVETVQWAVAVLELGLGRAEEAFTAAQGISGTLIAFWSGPDRIEAAVRAGSEEAARGWLNAFEPWATQCGTSWALAAALHCRALLCSGSQDAGRLFAAALDAHGDAARPFDRARTELAYGEFLRRSRRRIDARTHLRAALEQFEELGARAWTERASTELRASGQTARRREPSTRDELTPQELQIAQFVGQGLTNREVAAQLFLSPRTVDFHLRNVFRKLGISSRVALAKLDFDGHSS